MLAHPVKQLLTLIGQAGGVLTLSLAELAELGVEISATNICSDKEGALVLRLGPKIYYIPAPQEAEAAEAQWQDAEETLAQTPLEGVLPVSPRASGTASILAKELDAVNRLTNRPRPEPPPLPQPAPAKQQARPRPASRPLSPQSRPAPRTPAPAPPAPAPPEVEEIMPRAKVGVTRLDDAALWMREQARAEDVRQRERHDPNKYRDGDLPFRVIPGR